nr:immunoglobulin heavy chain junction region [Mus musculus]MBK4189977.1 immunoglobulin heavy chain junction region [Mus musculus]MBK4189978.1 immunoglobulin heavy chain junction region [Mus musculus]MBK4189979.1 immunoglobulin heavy chain junction region [Mus musculus]
CARTITTDYAMDYW